MSDAYLQSVPSYLETLIASRTNYYDDRDSKHRLETALQNKTCDFGESVTLPIVCHDEFHDMPMRSPW